MPKREVGYSRGPYAKGRERREAILKATLKVFSNRGYRGASLRAIAQEIDISPTLLQHYFPTREELLEEVIRAWDKENDQRSEGLHFLGHWLNNIRHNVEIPGLIRLYTTFAVEATDPDHPSHSFFEKRYERLTEQIRADVERQQSLGFTAIELDPVIIARLLVAACEGLQIRWLHAPTFDMHAEFVNLLNAYSLLTPEQEAKHSI